MARCYASTCLAILSAALSYNVVCCGLYECSSGYAMAMGRHDYIESRKKRAAERIQEHFQEEEEFPNRGSKDLYKGRSI